MSATSKPANAGNVHVKPGGDLHGMIETAERMVDYLDRQLPQVEAMAQRAATTEQLEKALSELAETRSVVTAIEAKLRALDERTDRDDKIWRGDSPVETQVYRAVGEVIVDSFQAFRRSNYRDVPEKYRTGRRAADQYEGSESLGGITVPTLTYDNVAYFQRERSAARALCYNFPMLSDKVDVPALTTGTPTVYYVSNGTAPTNSAITFATDKQMVSKTLMAVNVVEGELIEDTVLAYASFWAQVFLDQFNLKENKAVFSETATDSNCAFTGAVQAVTAYNSGSNVLATSSAHFSSVSYDNLVAMQNTVNANAREGCVWVMNKAQFRYIQALRDNNGFPLLASSYAGLPAVSPVPNPSQLRPTVLLGDPCYITEAMPSGVSTSGLGQVLYGNFKLGHFFGDRKQLAIQWSSEAAFTTGGLVMRARSRFATLNVLTDGFALLKTA